MATYEANDPINGGKLPYPAETFDGSTVIASCWGNDDPETEGLDGKPIPVWYGLLLLDPEYAKTDTVSVGYYRVVEVEPGKGIYNTMYFENIIPAAEYYSENITGGY